MQNMCHDKNWFGYDQVLKIYAVISGVQCLGDLLQIVQKVNKTHQSLKHTVFN